MPPVRRPRVAGLRNRPASTRDNADEFEPSESGREPGDEYAGEPVEPGESGRESLSGTLDLDDIEPGPTRDLEPDLEPERDLAVVEDLEEPIDLEEDRLDEDQLDSDLDSDEATPSPVRRPAGKRRATGTTRPADLTEAEARTKSHRARARVEDNPRKRAATQLSVAVVLTVAAIVLAGLAVWFRGESDSLRSADSNTALTDSGTSSEVVGQLKSAIEETFSYNYTDLQATQKAVDETLTGKARCEYDQLFGQVKTLAPKQKIVMVTAVRDIALIRLDGDRAEALVFIDQSSTRVDVNNSVAGEAQFAVLAHREGDAWKITEFNMFDQPLVNGQPAPKC
ncbi:MAG: hypothetical protein ACRDSK_06060 [Actinophytocola sp.]|uniref:hypothetical protein n=1 Tax=Actinophytocola sp. TaxID=1872138 RepID=UPI003D6BCD73